LPSGPKLDGRKGTAHHPASEFDSNPSQHRKLRGFSPVLPGSQRASADGLRVLLRSRQRSRKPDDPGGAVSKSGHAGTGFADQRLPLSQTPRDPIKWRLWQIAQDREKPVSRIVERRGGATSEATGDRQAASSLGRRRNKLSGPSPTGGRAWNSGAHISLMASIS
jgi:hypothetical protein